MNTIFMNSENSETFDPHNNSIFQIKQTKKEVINMFLHLLSMQKYLKNIQKQ